MLSPDRVVENKVLSWHCLGESAERRMGMPWAPAQTLKSNKCALTKQAVHCEVPAGSTSLIKVTF